MEYSIFLYILIQMAEETPTIAPEIAEELQEPPEKIEELVAERVLVEETLPELVPESKRKPGRPAGSRNKGPAKPRPKRVVVSEAVEYAPEPPPPPATPRWDAQHQPIPTKATTEMAELMLRMLSGQAMERQRRKDEQRRAWFS